MPSQSVVFDRAADFYDETRGFPPGQEAAVADLFIRAGNLTFASRVLEIGIGTGRIALPLAPHVRAMFGVDLSTKMMRRLRTKRDDEPIYLAQADANRLPFPAHSLDAAVAVHVFHLMADWQGALHELARVLRPDAPLLHGWNLNQRGDAFAPLNDAWEAAIPDKARAELGVRWEQRETFLTDLGWRKTGDDLSVVMTLTRTPQGFVDRLERRTWSRTWQLSDEHLARGIAAVRAAIDEHFGGDLHRPVEVNSGFAVQVYLPPA